MSAAEGIQTRSLRLLSPKCYHYTYILLHCQLHSLYIIGVSLSEPHTYEVVGEICVVTCLFVTVTRNIARTIYSLSR